MKLAALMVGPRDIEIAARTIHGEARGEGFLGKVAVAWCIRNRVEIDLGNDGKPDWWGEGFEAVCLKAFQFSCWNKNDPNRAIIEKVPATHAVFRESLAALAAVLGNMIEDPTGGATHYKVATWPWPKDWGAPQAPTYVVGKHAFYRLER